MYWLTALLGLALGAAPWVFSYTDNNTAAWASIIIGAVIFLVSLYMAVSHGKLNGNAVAGFADLIAKNRKRGRKW